MTRSIFDNLDASRARAPSAPVWEVDEKLTEALRRIEEQRRLIEHMALIGRPTTEANFDLNRMYLLHAVLLQMRQRMGKRTDPVWHRPWQSGANAVRQA